MVLHEVNWVNTSKTLALAHLDARDTPAEGGDALVGLLLVELPHTPSHRETSKSETENNTKTSETSKKGLEQIAVGKQRGS